MLASILMDVGGILLVFGFPIATGFLYLLIGLSEDPGFDASAEQLTAIGFFWPVTFPYLFFIAAPVAVYRAQVKYAKSLSDDVVVRPLLEKAG